MVLSNPNYVNDDERASDIVMLIIGGHDTTAYGVAFMMLEIARKHTNASPLPEIETFRKDIQNLPKNQWKNSSAMQNIIREGLRLNPPVAFGGIRLTGRDYDC